MDPVDPQLVVNAQVLVVTPDPALRQMIALTLGQIGCVVAHVCDEGQALDELSGSVPDLILLDVGVAGASDYQICATLRQRPATEHIPILVIVNHDDIGTIDAAAQLGATDFVTKPILWPILLHRVRQMLRSSVALHALRSSQRRLTHAQVVTNTGDWEWELASGAIQPSDQLCDIFGAPAAVWRNGFERVSALVHPQDRDAFQQAFAALAQQGQSFAMDHRIVRPDGSERYVHHQANVIEYGGDLRVLRATGTAQDITERKKVENQIWQLAYFDSLTTLPNRTMFTELLKQAIASARRRSTMLAVMFLDLDNFKRINDTLGHAYGDELLSAVAARLTDCVRASDAVARIDQIEHADEIARLGGDEFTILLSDITSPDQAGSAAERVLNALNAPFLIGGHEIVSHGSIGIAMYPADGTDSGTLLKNADAAMYRAKERGRNTFRLYDGSMNAHAHERLALEGELRRAIERNELVLHYQPRVDIATGRICGAEALVRWQHPERGMVPPGAFIGLAEHIGLIVPLGEWVLHQACMQQQNWRAQGYQIVPVSVNLATPHVRRQDLPEQIAALLQAHDLPPSMLELEVTESLMMRDVEATTRVLNQLSTLGVATAIDDFGTGYSSMMYLKRLPIQTLKVDRAFIRDLASDPDDAAIVNAIIAMAHSLKMSVVAEGVETDEQLQFLREHDCDQYQGFLFSKPVTPEKFACLLNTSQLSIA